MPDQDRESGSDTKEIKRKYGYTLSLLFVFVVPFLFLFRTIIKNVQLKPFLITTGIVCLLGWAWSILLSLKGWWHFPQEFILGIYVVPNLPLEEFLIYPLGGIFSIYAYTGTAKKFPEVKNPALHWAYLIGVTTIFAFLAYSKRETVPYYLYSQFVLYNGLALLLAFVVAKETHLSAFLASGFILGSIGLIWDYFAFKYGWWIYYAITNIKIANIPIEDFNFYLMAPAAAVSLYIVMCQLYKVPPVKTKIS